jgi:DNA-binding LytR/AlgR family response regulator
MNPLRCLIIEDEFTAIDLLKMYIDRKADTLVCTHVCDNANEALCILQENPIDLIFLDMEISGRMNGLDFLQFTEHNQQRPPIIVTTGKKEYLPESFQYRVKAYLFKPFSFETFNKKIEDLLISLEKSDKKEAIKQAKSDFIFIKITEKGHAVTKKLAFSSLKYIEAKDKQAHYCMDDGSRWSVWDSLDTITKDILPEQTCCRAHDKWVIGAKAHIKEARWSDDYLLMTDGLKIPIGQTYKVNLRKYLTL